VCLFIASGSPAQVSAACQVARQAIPGVAVTYVRMSQAWPLSQTANKVNGVCSVCHATRQLHLKDGTVHRHGPRNQPCSGSHKPPLGPSGASVLNQPPAVPPDVPSAGPTPSTDQPQVHFDWSPPECASIRHIPKAARPACASHLASLLRQVVAHPESQSQWKAVLNWAGSVLFPAKRGGKRHNMTSTIKSRLASSQSSTTVTQTCRPVVRRRNEDPDSQLARVVAAKLEDGNLRAAVRILCSEDSPAQPSLDGLAKLQAKHPPATLCSTDLPSPDRCQPLEVEESDVQKAIMSFPAGSAGGPDGLRPQHLKEVISCRESGQEILTDLTAFINLVLAGRCPKSVAPVFFGGRMLALNKKCGGIRPIAVGLTLRRLASKCANSAVLKRLRPDFAPRQLGLGTPGGCEAAVHTTRRFLESLAPDHVVVKLDFSNAFNSIHRGDMLQAVFDRIPELFAFASSAYSVPSILFYGPFRLFSQEGTQQGDPLGPLLFCNTVQPLLLSLLSELTLGYLDDFTLGGDVATVAQDVSRIADLGSKMGLTLNVAKCELVAHSSLVVDDPLLRSFGRIEPGDATLLGAPLFSGRVLNNFWSDRCSDLSRAVDRLCMVGRQDALILLRGSFSAPRVQHLLRCSPSVDAPGPLEFDNLLRTALSRITNNTLSDSQWLQASLPIKLGGLGIRRVSSLALPAFLASAASTLLLQDEILGGSQPLPDELVESLTGRWEASHGPAPSGQSSSKQSSWDRPGLLVESAAVEESRTSPLQRASLLAARAPHSGDWLLALPISACGLRLEDEAVRIAVALRLGSELGSPHTCRCGSLVDAFGVHGLVCKQAPSRVVRHHALNECISRAFSAAGIPVKKEPPGLVQKDGKRPDGCTLIPWCGGRCLAWDVTVCTTVADSYVFAASQSAGSVAEQAADRKSQKYAELSAAYVFQPVAVESHGPMDEATTCFLSDLGRKISERSGEPLDARFLFQRISVLIQRFNSILFHDTFPVEDGIDT